MKIILIGATGTIGRAIVKALGNRHEIIKVSANKSAIKVDLADKASIVKMYQAAGKVDAVISAAGQAAFKPFQNLTDEDFALSCGNKLMGQVNLVREGLGYVKDKGAFILTAGILSRKPMKGSAAVSLVNAGLEGFGRAAAQEMPRGIRLNVISPNWVTDTLRAYNMDPSIGTPVEEVARTYVRVLESGMNGQVIDAAAPERKEAALGAA